MYMQVNSANMGSMAAPTQREGKAGAPTSGEAGGGEVRRVNLVYYLSRGGGRVDHPHLLRIHRLRKDRVYLRDVKRWLSEFRGKGMPESFSWSYKRRYRDGFVWQDAKDDDLITPFSDNEYVLIGCELQSQPPTTATAAAAAAATVNNKQAPAARVDEIRTPAAVAVAEAAGAATLQMSPRDDQPTELDGDWSGGTADESSSKQTSYAIVKIEAREKPAADQEKRSRLAYRNDITEAGNAKDKTERSESGNNYEYSKRAMQVLRDLLRCKAAVETDDGALRRPVRPPRKEKSYGGGDDHDSTDSREMGMSSGRSWRREGKQQESAGAAVVYKPPAAKATCSQCGKAFKPQNLHSHMSSCRGLTRREK